ncbi:hypothetical protein GCM10027037_03620 [Mucilaginibacter koreensis]
MTTVSENTWNEQDDLKNNNYHSTDTVTGPSDVVDPDEDDLDDDEDLEDDDLDYDDEDFEDDDLDADDLDDDDDLDEDDDGYERVSGTPTADLSSGIANSYEGGDDDDNEIPEQQEADTEEQGYDSGTEVEQQDRGDEGSFSEQTDVTPPTPHEFPSTGTHTETDFASRNQGRTTGRMIGHEPGTEGI